jgi:nucleoside phosphorylase
MSLHLSDELPTDLTRPCRDAVVITALPVEYLAITAHLRELRKCRFEGDVYEQGLFVATGLTWRVTVAEVGAGNAPAALHTGRALRCSGAHTALFVGIAGGIKDVALGDVVAADKVYSYESGADKEHLQPRPRIGQSSHELVQEARRVCRQELWQLRRPGANTSTGSTRALVGALVAGEKVLKNRSSAVMEFVTRQYSDALAVDMEGFGFLLATHQSHRKPDSIVIRGISDLIGNKEQCDGMGWQSVAACHAAAFAFELLASLGSTSAQADDAGDDSIWKVTFRVRLEDLPSVLARLRLVLDDEVILAPPGLES